MNYVSTSGEGTGVHSLIITAANFKLKMLKKSIYKENLYIGIDGKIAYKDAA